ncbi:hypothetical protein AMD24_00616 [Candidatus Xiphinematobacter sp. Idaho Grape]|nr:hypothetical protein AMD24_00616 [Candidatus Xiphinematobacter sp. Idaho Grape]
MRLSSTSQFTAATSTLQVVKSQTAVASQVLFMHLVKRSFHNKGAGVLFCVSLHVLPACSSTPDRMCLAGASSECLKTQRKECGLFSTPRGDREVMYPPGDVST